MSKLYTSASKLVFLALTATACAGFIIDKLPVDQFMLLCSMAFSFYFANKGSGTDEYLGK
jgi:hypothetical protein